MIEQLKTIREFFDGISVPYETLIAFEQLEAMVGKQEPVAWAVYWGLPPTRQNSVHFDKESAQAVANQIKSATEVRPLYAAPVAQQPQARPDFTDEWAGYLKDGETPFERFLRERKDVQSALKLYQRALEENERLKAQQPQAEAVPQDVGQLEYRGNSVAYIHQKMTAYRGAIDAAWQAMRDAGHPPDGCTPLAQAITKALAPQQAEPHKPLFADLIAQHPGLREELLEMDKQPQAEAVPPGYVLVPVEPTAGMCKAAADAWLDCGSRLVLNKAKAAIAAAIAQQKGN